MVLVYVFYVYLSKRVLHQISDTVTHAHTSKFILCGEQCGSVGDNIT